MLDPILKPIFPEINSFHTNKTSTLSKDLFTKKLGHHITIDFKTTKKNYTILELPKSIKNMKTLPKNKTNILLSLNKEENLRKLWDPDNKINFSKNKLWGVENNKQGMNIQIDSALKNTKSKKEIKRWLNNKEQNIKPKRIIFDSIPDMKNNNSNNTINTKFKRTFFYEGFDHPMIIINKKLNFQKLKLRNKSDNNFRTVIDRISKEEKKSKIFIKSFYESLIDISIIYGLYNKYVSLINNFNETFFFLFEIEKFPINPMNIKFLNTYKFLAIFNISLIFLAKDKNLYEENILKIKELLEKYICICIKTIDYKKLDSPKINNFITQIKFLNENLSLIDLSNEIVDILFGKKLNEYKKLRKCIKQLINNIGSLTPSQVLSIINDSILFWHNSCNYYYNTTKDDKKKKNKIKSSKGENNIISPFIKNKMTKKFCLVLDLDETLIHKLNLPFGEYYFIRPGVFDLLEKVHDIYEIIIFTAGKKKYAYNIIDKIDSKDNIDYILYKKHLSNIEGNLVKKLDLIGRDLNKIICVDNLEKNAKYNKENLYLISSWYNDIFDKELIFLKNKLIKIANDGKYDNDITKALLEN